MHPKPTRARQDTSQWCRRIPQRSMRLMKSCQCSTKTPSSRRRLTSGSVVSQRNSRRSRRDGRSYAPFASRSVAAQYLHGDCLDLIPTLDDCSVSLVVTSPPYADQRAGHYESVPEEDYPDFTVNWMTALEPKMTPDGSVFVVIRPHLRAGVISDYVLRTRLTLREAGWNECEELIWLKPGAPPLGSLKNHAAPGRASCGSAGARSRTATSRRVARNQVGSGSRVRFGSAWAATAS